ncbi:UNVERIFIED_CONTAM: hypothetical protein Scaly_0256400 [Sesamum calycinum]|uniref:Tf2-1-like SH3-like domain-containing protein n=1 Tax=Sesamum calycinum TaxID=2727403 RepID=A0AAW2S956_9LAMI
MVDSPRRNTSSVTSTEELSPALLGAIQPIVSAAIREQMVTLAPVHVATLSDVDVPKEEAEKSAPVPAPSVAARQGPPQLVQQEAIQRIGKVAYKLDLPPHTKIHSTFHVSQLKKCHGDSVAPQSLPVMLTPHGHLVLEPKVILDRRIILFHNRSLTQILVKWFNTPTKDNIWENYYEFMQKFPNYSRTVWRGGHLL